MQQQDSQQPNSDHLTSVVGKGRRLVMSEGTSEAPEATGYSVHTPERHPDESMGQYRARRAESKRLMRESSGYGVSHHNRTTPSASEQFRDAMRKNGTMGKRTRAYMAVMAAFAERRIVNWKGPRDQHGAYTVTGGHRYEWVETGNADSDGYNQWLGRRKWLAGISAQRGY